MGSSLKSIGWVGKVGWTDEAREAAAASRARNTVPKSPAAAGEKTLGDLGWRRERAPRGSLGAQSQWFYHSGKAGHAIRLHDNGEWEHHGPEGAFPTGNVVVGAPDQLANHLAGPTGVFRPVSRKKAEWTEVYKSDLPDSSFAYVEPGGVLDDVGKTTPRALRHLPFKDAGGNVDAGQLAAAVAAVGETSLPEATKAKVRARLEKAAGEVHWPVVPRPGFRGSSLTDAGEKAPNQKAAPDGPGSRVQELVFDKARYPKVADAAAWANDHGFASGDADDAGEQIRLRQPTGGLARSRTITLTEGVEAVVGVPRRTVKALQDVFFMTASGRLAFKSADLSRVEVEPVAESEVGDIYRVSCGGLRMYVAERGGAAAHLPSYHVRRSDAPLAIVKSVPEQRYTLGVVYPAKEVDFHGDFMTEVELEKAAWGVMQKGEPPKVGLMHRPGTAGAGTVVESYVYRGPTWTSKGADGAEQVVDTGDWLMGVVWNDVAWEAVKSGQLKGYSLQGVARKEAF